MEDTTEKKRTYKTKKEAQRYAILNLNCELQGVWSGLKKLCDEMKERDAAFLSYSSLSKRRGKDENPIKFTTEQGEYAVYIEKLK